MGIYPEWLACRDYSSNNGKGTIQIVKEAKLIMKDNINRMTLKLSKGDIPKRNYLRLKINCEVR